MKASIRLDRLGHVVKKISQINKQAEKRGFNGVELTQGKTFTVEHKDNEGYTWIEERIELTITSDLPPTPGYRIIGIRNEKDGIPYYSDNLPPVYRKLQDFVCGHCHSQRKRNFFAVVKKDGEDQEIVVGSSCFAQIFGPTSAESLIAHGNHMQIIREVCLDDPDFVPGSSPSWFSVDRYLAIVTQISDRNGFLSRYIPRCPMRTPLFPIRLAMRKQIFLDVHDSTFSAKRMSGIDNLPRFYQRKLIIKSIRLSHLVP